MKTKVLSPFHPCFMNNLIQEALIRTKHGRCPSGALVGWQWHHEVSRPKGGKEVGIHVRGERGNE